MLGQLTNGLTNPAAANLTHYSTLTQQLNEFGLQEMHGPRAKAAKPERRISTAWRAEQQC